MSDIQFNAILSKNEIARELVKEQVHSQGQTLISIKYCLEQLKEIEKFIGQGNQPSVEDIFRVNSSKQFGFTI